MKILISGAGIAGPTLAYWLLKYGFKPTLVERSPKLRTGGYVIDFWGAGYDIAERMGLLPEICQKGYLVKEVKEVSANGNRVAGFPVHTLVALTKGRYISISRGDLAAAIFNSLENKVETIFDDGISRIDQSENGVRVEFEHAKARDFDLVVGADGLHSNVRELVFGPQSQYEKYLGFKVAAFEASGYRPREELTYVTHTEVGQQVGRFAMRDDRTMFLFCFADENQNEPRPRDVAGQKALLRSRFERSGWECPKILAALDSTSDLYFDRVSQIRMNPAEGLWTKGRVTLIGDAASCVSLLAGQGSALAMIAAYILAGELKRAKGNHQMAFSRYQEIFGPFVSKKQKAAEWFAGGFAPKSRLGLFLRNQIFNALGITWVAKLVAKDMLDKVELADYS
jgi:2-polyprenyl-6-methoxyphenol hydroxylase-like FAD-dependent oxidoreductase